MRNAAESLRLTEVPPEPALPEEQFGRILAVTFIGRERGMTGVQAAARRLLDGGQRLYRKSDEVLPPRIRLSF